jgi:hypothetical protein
MVRATAIVACTYLHVEQAAADPLDVWKCYVKGQTPPGLLKLDKDNYWFVESDAHYVPVPGIRELSGGYCRDQLTLVPLDGPFLDDFVMTGSLNADETQIVWASGAGIFMTCER